METGWPRSLWQCLLPGGGSLEWRWGRGLWAEGDPSPTSPGAAGLSGGCSTHVEFLGEDEGEPAEAAMGRTRRQREVGVTDGPGVCWELSALRRADEASVGVTPGDWCLRGRAVGGGHAEASALVSLGL